MKRFREAMHHHRKIKNERDGGIDYEKNNNSISNGNDNTHV